MGEVHPWCFWLGQADFLRLLPKLELCLLALPWLQDARQKFRSVLVEATVKLDELVKKIGKAVEDSKPYWEARRVARQVRWSPAGVWVHLLTSLSPPRLEVRGHDFVNC